ncbi:MAG: DUF5989 family protein [Chloroflexota bacterium]
MAEKQTNKPNALQDLFGRLGVIGELLSFLWERKLYWLIPMILVLIIFGALILFSSNPATQPFIYTLF